MDIPTVTVRLENTTCHCQRLVIKVENHPKIESQTFSREDLQRVVGKFRDTLQKISEIYQGSHNKPEEQLNNLRGSIAEIGVFNAYFKEVLKDTYRKIQESLFELVESRQKKLRRVEERISYEEPVGIIICEGNIGDFIPLEFLLLHDLEGGGKSSESLGQAMEYLTQVIGFSFLIVRNPLKKKKPLTINNTNLLKLHLYYAIPAALFFSKEVSFFKDHLNCFAVREIKLQDAADYAAEKLVDSLVTSDSHFYHFICHAGTRPEDGEYFLEFKDGNVTLADLWQSLNNSKSKQTGNFHSSLTFLNACNSAVANPDGNVLTFPEMFLEHLGQDGFIGTEFSVLQGFAYRFAIRFYANLLNNGNDGNLEKALFKTRWFFVSKHLHLMGLFYTLYAAAGSKVVLSTSEKIQLYED